MLQDGLCAIMQYVVLHSCGIMRRDTCMLCEAQLEIVHIVVCCVPICIMLKSMVICCILLGVLSDYICCMRQAELGTYVAGSHE